MCEVAGGSCATTEANHTDRLVVLLAQPSSRANTLARDGEGADSQHARNENGDQCHVQCQDRGDDAHVDPCIHVQDLVENSGSNDTDDKYQHSDELKSFDGSLLFLCQVVEKRRPRLSCHRCRLPVVARQRNRRPSRRKGVLKSV